MTRVCVSSSPSVFSFFTFLHLPSLSLPLTPSHSLSLPLTPSPPPTFADAKGRTVTGQGLTAVSSVGHYSLRDYLVYWTPGSIAYHYISQCHSDVSQRGVIAMWHSEVSQQCVIAMCHSNISLLSQRCVIAMCHSEVSYRCVIARCHSNVSQ